MLITYIDTTIIHTLKIIILTTIPVYHTSILTYIDSYINIKIHNK